MVIGLLKRKDMEENSLYDKKSLREITGKSAEWNEVAKDCVAFSNAQGGVIDYGIEDGADAPPADQKVSEDIAINLEKKLVVRHRMFLHMLKY